MDVDEPTAQDEISSVDINPAANNLASRACSVAKGVLRGSLDITAIADDSRNADGSRRELQANSLCHILATHCHTTSRHSPRNFMFCAQSVYRAFRTFERWGDKVTGYAGPYFIGMAVILITTGTLAFRELTPQ